MKQIRDINRSNWQNGKDNEERMIYVIEFCGRKADMDDFKGGESILDP